MKFALFLLIELLRLASCLAAVGLWLAFGLLCTPADGAPMALATRDHGPWMKTPEGRTSALLSGRSVASVPSVPSSAAPGRHTALARITVYSPDEPRSDRWTRRRKSATGVRLAWGHCAVDPRRIPYGSTVIVGRHKFLAVDCGGGVRGWHVDIFFERWRDARRFNAATPDRMPITVIRPRS